MSYLLGCPLEASDNWILDFIEVLDSLGAVHQDVRSGRVWTEAPDLTGFSDVIFVFVGQVTGTSLQLVTGIDFTLLEQKILISKTAQLFGIKLQADWV